MAITVLPRTQSGGEAFTEGFQPYLQMAFQMMMKRKMEEQQRQRNIEQAQQMFPGLMQEVPSQYAETGMGTVPVKPTSPKIPKRYQFNMEQAQKYPGVGIDLTSGQMEYKVPSIAPTIGIYSADQSGQIQKTGEIPRGAKVLTPSQLETPEMKQEREIETTKQKKAAEVGAESQAVDNMATAVWEAADKLIPAPTEPAQAERLGMERRLKTTGIGGFRPQRLMGISDEDALAFDQIKRGEATPLIRALGEKGMLTNQDIERAYNLMPHFSDTKKLRDTKKEELKKFLKSRVNAYYQDLGQQVEQQLPPGFNPNEWEIVK